MGRDGIKIIEFDRNAAATAAGDPDHKRGIRIVEFDDERPDGGGSAPRRPEIGPIRILEFDGDRPAAPPAPSAPPKTAVGPIKIKDFGAAAETGWGGGTRARIRIVEFD